MKLRKIFISALLSAVPIFGFAQAIETAPVGYSLRWSDEFDGTTLNEKNWNYETGNGNWGFGNGELEYYTNRPENVKVSDGKLVITAKREDYNGFKFTSGRINGNSKVYFKYGVIQAKIKFPKTANGLWPAYWMMGNDINKYGWPKCGEMDIVEMGFSKGIETGWQDRYFGGTLHWGPNNNGHQYSSQDFASANNNYDTDYSKWPAVEDGEWHIVTVDWDAEKCRMYLDLEGYNNPCRNKAVFASFDIPQSEDPNAVGTYFHKPFYFLFNVAVGGTYTGIMNADGITCFNDGDKQMEVDWVRVYQKDGDESAQYYYTDENGIVQTNIEAEPEPEPQPDNKTELSSFASKALDDNGESTFDFSDVEKAVAISVSDGVRGHLYDACGGDAADGGNFWNYFIDNDSRNFYFWENTYMAMTTAGQTNSFGWDEGYTKLYVPDGNTWSGAGFNYTNTDLSMIENDWWLHFAMRGTDIERHTSHEIYFGNAKFFVGNSNGKLASIGDFKRDGEWYYFDIPVSALKQMCASEPFITNAAAFTGNIIELRSGNAGAELCFDNIFFYKSKGKEIPSYAVSDVNLGKYGYKSLDENGEPVKVFDKTTVKNMAPITLDNTSREIFTGNGSYNPDENVVGDQSLDYSLDNNYFIWSNTLWTENKENIKNSLGLDTAPYAYWHDNGNDTWNGYGIIGQTAKDFSIIDDSYMLHIELMSEEAVAHIPVTVGIGNSSITFGSYSTKTIFADFGRDGQWYSFDIPVAVLKQWGTLFDDTDKANQKKNAWADNILTFSTGETQYYGSGFAYGNIFFWKPVDETQIPGVNPLGDYTTKSLDESNNSYFDFAGKDFIIISTNGDVTERMKSFGDEYHEENILADYRPGVEGANFYNWTGNSYRDEAKPEGVVNSFGGDESWLYFSTHGGWTGAGFVKKTDDGTGADFTVLEDGNWHLHFAMRGTDNCNHQIGFGEAKFTIGGSMYDGKVPVLGNYERNGEWYSYDIPYSVLKNYAADMFPSNNGGQGNYVGNIFWFMSGGGEGDEIQIDNVFLWRDKDSATGIETPEITAPVKNTVTGIFDLSGRKVQSMSKPGMYIIRTADSVKKVIVK